MNQEGKLIQNAIRISVLQNRIVATTLVRCSQNPENIWKVERDINMLYGKGVNKETILHFMSLIFRPMQNENRPVSKQ